MSEKAPAKSDRSISSSDVAMWVGGILGLICVVLAAEWFGGDFVGDDSEFGYADWAISVAIWVPVGVGLALAIQWIISRLHIIVPVVIGIAVFSVYMEWL